MVAVLLLFRYWHRRLLTKAFGGLRSDSIGDTPEAVELQSQSQFAVRPGQVISGHGAALQRSGELFQGWHSRLKQP